MKFVLDKNQNHCLMGTEVGDGYKPGEVWLYSTNAHTVRIGNVKDCTVVSEATPRELRSLIVRCVNMGKHQTADMIISCMMTQHQQGK